MALPSNNTVLLMGSYYDENLEITTQIPVAVDENGKQLVLYSTDIAGVDGLQDVLDDLQADIDTRADDAATTAALATKADDAATTASLAALTPLVLVGRTASATQTQGQGAITLTAGEMLIFVQVATCAVAGNAQTLPAAVANRVVQFTNNGAQACGVFPASGDNAGAGVDTVVSVAAGATKWFLASDSTNWTVV